jgi:hypothetical protein
MRFTHTGVFAAIVGASMAFVFAAMLKPAVLSKPTDPARAANKPTFEFKHFADVQGSRVAVFEFCNPTEKPLYFHGYGEKNPQLFFQRQASNGRWKTFSWHWCGTGMDMHEMPAHSSMQIGVSGDEVRMWWLEDGPDDALESPNPIRGGVRFYRTKKGESAPVWSQPISLNIGE